MSISNNKCLNCVLGVRMIYHHLPELIRATIVFKKNHVSHLEI